MNTNDKNYVDRLHNQQVNELNEIKNRLLILEGKPTSAPNGTIRVELDTDKLYDILFKAYEDCLQQRQERREEEYRIKAEKQRQEWEAKGEPYFTSDDEWRAAIVKDYREFFNKMLTLVTITDLRFRDVNTSLLKLLKESPKDTTSPSVFSNLPSGFKSKLTELRRRLNHRIRSYLTGSFALHRGWTILTLILYLAFFFILLYIRTTITFSQ